MSRPRTRPAAPATPRPLVVSADDALVDDLLRLLAAAGATAELTTGGGPLRRSHRDAPLVLLGSDVLSRTALRGLPRRPGVLVVSPDDPAPDLWAAAVDVGAERVVVLPRDETWLVERVAAAVTEPARPGWVLAVGGSCGGAGASTLATAVAVVAAPAEPVGQLLVDGDGWGAGLDLLLGAEGEPGLRWPELAEVTGRVPGTALAAALPAVAGVAVLAASRDDPGEVPAEALRAVVAGARDGGLGVVVDLPARGPAAEAVLPEADLAVLVVPARLRAALAARQLLDGSSPWSAARVVTRPVPGGLARDDVADLLGRSVLAELADDRSAVARCERGEPPSVAARSPLGLVGRLLLTEAARRAR